VLARPDSRWYRASRFAARHRVAVGAAATAFAAVLAGAGLAVWQAGESRQQRDAALRARGHADRQAEAAELARRIADANAELADFLLADLSAGRSAQQMEQQLERAIVAVRARHAGDARVRTQLLINLAGRFRQLGNFARQRALMAELEVSARAIDDPLALGRLLCWRARDSVFDGRIAQARELIAQARRELARAAHVPTGHRTSCLADESAIARLAGDGARAVAAIEEAVQLERQAGLARTESHADSLFSLARAYGQSGRFREAVDAAQHSLDLRRDLGQAGSAGMANVRTIMATLLRDGGRVDLALAALDALRAADRVPSATLAFHHAATLVEAGRLGEALPMLARVQQEAKDLNDRTTARAAAMARVSALAARGTLDEARRVLADAEVLYDELRAERSYGVRRLLAARIDLALAADDVPAAERGLGELDGLLEGLGNASDPAWRAAHGQAARVALKQQRFERALQRAEAALALANRQAIDPERSVFVGEALLLRARARQGLGDAGGSARDAAAAAWHLQARGAAPAAGAP
jgi:tetratricopeptide (TPR) repeat protein